MTKHSDLTGLVVVITGGARGIGRATAERRARAGARVAIGDLDAELAASTAAELLQSTGGRVVAAGLDVTDPQSWTTFLNAPAIADLGPVDVLVNNAGIMPLGSVLKESDDVARKIVDVNLHGVILGTKAVAPAMQARGGGSIVNFSSPQGLEGRHGMSAYTASKFGVRGLTRTAAMELGEHGIRVNAVVPGPTRTAMTERKRWTDEQYDEVYGGYPLGRMGRPEEVAALCVFLASDESSFCTGADFVVDGGVLAGKPR